MSAMERAKFVICGDIVDFFTNVNTAWLMSGLRNRIAAKSLLELIAQWLNAYTVDDRNKRIILPGEKGIPQGAVISTLLAAYYLSLRFDRVFYAEGCDKEYGAQLVRYFDNNFKTCLRKPEELATRMELLLKQHELHCTMAIERTSGKIPVLGLYLQKTPTGVKKEAMPAKVEKLASDIAKSHEEWRRKQAKRIAGWEGYYGRHPYICETGTFTQPTNMAGQLGVRHAQRPAAEDWQTCADQNSIGLRGTAPRTTATAPT